MELDSFILTVEDFLDGRLSPDFLREEISYMMEEVLELDNEFSHNVLDGLQEMMKYFNEEEKLEYIRSGLKSIKNAQVLFEKETIEDEGNEADVSELPSEEEKPPGIQEVKEDLIPERGEAAGEEKFSEIIISDEKSEDKLPETDIDEKISSDTLLQKENELSVESDSKESGETTSDLLHSMATQYAVPSDMKHRVTVQKYLEKPEENQELKIDTISDPVNSPLYGMLLVYEGFKLEKKDIKILIQGLLEGEEELNYLLDKIETSTARNAKMEELSELILEALNIIEEMQLEFSDVKEEEKEEIIEEYIKNLRDINLNIYRLNKEVFSSGSGFTVTDSIKDAIEKFSDEDFKTTNYISIEKGVNDFLAGDMDKDQLLYLLVNMRDVIATAQEQYESLPVSEDELTLEVLRGDKLLNEGFSSWIYGLELIEESLDEKDEETLYEGLDYIFNGNKKLVLVQYFSEQVRRQTERQESFTDKWSVK